MAYTGKFIDRDPKIKAAGVDSSSDHGVQELLTHASLDDKVKALKHEAGIVSESVPLSAPVSYALPPDGGTRYEGQYNKMAEILKPTAGTDYQQFRSELQETSFRSHWDAPLSASSYQYGTLPKGFNPITTTLGKPTPKDGTVAELVSPQKLPGQVLFENAIGHKMYVTSHKDYDPGEQVSRNYLPGNYDPADRWGLRIPYDPRGIGFPKCVNWCNNEPFTVVSDKQTDIVVHRPQVGKTLVRERVLGNKVPQNHTFGKATLPNNVSVQELIHYNGNPAPAKLEECDYARHINTIRLQLTKNPSFNWKDFEASFRHRDVERHGMLSLDQVYAICDTFNLNFEKPLLEKLMWRLSVFLCKNQVVYSRFVQMLNPNYEFPSFVEKIPGVLIDYLNYDTTYDAAYQPPVSQDILAAGIPSTRNDLRYPKAVLKALKEHLGDETDVPALINPSCLTRNGLSHRDLFLPRSLGQLNIIFGRMNIVVPKCFADIMYERGLRFDGTGGVCIYTWQNILEKMCEGSLKKKW